MTAELASTEVGTRTEIFLIDVAMEVESLLAHGYGIVVLGSLKVGHQCSKVLGALLSRQDFRIGLEILVIGDWFGVDEKGASKIPFRVG